MPLNPKCILCSAFDGANNDPAVAQAALLVAINEAVATAKATPNVLANQIEIVNAGFFLDTNNGLNTCTAAVLYSTSK